MDYDIHDEWLGYELHPEIPPEGRNLASRSGKRDDSMFDMLSRMGAKYGITFNKLTHLANSHLALEATEFARDRGQFDLLHEKIFQAYFTELQDIGNLEVILAIGEETGLNRAELKEALEERRYAERLQEAIAEGKRNKITGAPTFIINEQYKIFGAQPIEKFRKLLEEIKES